jgi:hypothetical protein
VSIFTSNASRPRKRSAIAITLASCLVLSTLGSVGAASAAAKPPTTPTDAAPHCLTRVIGKLASGELQLSTPACYPLFSDVLRNAGQPVSDKSISPSQASQQGLLGLRAPGGGAVALGLNGMIGVHFDGSGYSGASISVQGSDCYGGYINLSGWWANRVSSTINGCPAVVHYYWPNLGGSSEATYGGGGNLTWLNNLSESIAYAGW